MKTSGSADNLASLVGQIIVRVRRIFYVLGEVVDESKGAIELGLAGDQKVLFDSGSDGESLRITRESWIDPFAGALTEANSEYIDRSGKWAAYDVSKWPQYRSIVNGRIVEISKIVSPEDKVIGALVRTDLGNLLRVEVAADDLYVQLT